VALAAGSARAQHAPGDARSGRELAERLCTNCHAVTAQAHGPMSTDVPSFPSIANRPGVTPEMLAGRITVPHPAMPGVQLTVRELRDIIAYIWSLKRAN
jgi:mono/diheme cytochrome c family protein